MEARITAMAISHLHPEHVCIGIDIGKTNHIAAFISPSLLRSHHKFDACPTLSIKQSRTDFERLVEHMQLYASPESCSVLMERTGHYHHALKQYLQERNITVYEVHVSDRESKIKTDKRDALQLANALYTQIELGVQVAEASRRVQKIQPPTPEAARLKPLVLHAYDLRQSVVRRKNQLTAICDELFPEMTQVIKDVVCDFALNVRERYPTAKEIAAADLQSLLACRGRGHPSALVVQQMHDMAKHSIAITEPYRRQALCFAQAQLIAEVRLLQQHVAELEEEIKGIIATSRQGQILTSMPMIKAMTAATIIACIGNIENFEKPSQLRSYFGWSPTTVESGTSINTVALTSGGSRIAKQILYLTALHSIHHDTEWRDIYERLVPLKCVYDARLKKYRGRNKVIGRIAGQIIGLIWTLLKRDHDLLVSLPAGVEPPAPALYDRSIHHAHRQM